MMEVLDCLLEGDGDEETDADGADMDEKVFPRVRWSVRRMYVMAVSFLSRGLREWVEAQWS
jgi:hypothetical protein